MIDKLEIIFWKFAKYIIRKGYGYCEELDGEAFMSNGRCCVCDATQVQQWIDKHIELIKL